MCVFLCLYIRVYVYVFVYVFEWVCVFSCVSVFICVRMCLCLCGCVCACFCLCFCVCLCVIDYVSFLEDFPREEEHITHIKTKLTTTARTSIPTPAQPIPLHFLKESDTLLKSPSSKNSLVQNLIMRGNCYLRISYLKNFSFNPIWTGGCRCDTHPCLSYNKNERKKDGGL